MVTLLTAGASLQSGALRLESDNSRSDMHADVTSLRSDAKEIYRRIQDTPASLHAVWSDFVADWKDLKADASAEAHDAARRIGSFVNSKPKPVS